MELATGGCRNDSLELLFSRLQYLLPTIDWAGPAPGYVGTEFPLVPFLALLLYLLLRVQEWIGRFLLARARFGWVLFYYLTLETLAAEVKAVPLLVQFRSE